MPQFRYEAASSAAEIVKGQLEAANKSAVVDRLHAMGHVPIRIEEIGTSRIANFLAREILLSPALSRRGLSLLTAQLAMLLRAGVPLDEALTILQDLAETKAARDGLRQVREGIGGGATLADAMAAQKLFPPFYVSMVRAGEASADLENVLERLAEFLDRSHAMREHIKSALLYPAIVALVCCLSVAVLFLFVVPRFRPIFEQSGDALPASAAALLAISEAVQRFWWVLPLSIGLVWLFARRQWRNPLSRRRWEARLLRLPLIGEMIRRVETARFSRMLGTLLRNGVPLLSALLIARETMRNEVFANAVSRIMERVKTGKGLAEPFRQSQVFPPLAVHLLRVGEETGRQDEMLMQIADIFEAETRRSVDRVLSLLGPAVTIALGVLVAGVVLSIMTALLSIYDVAL